MSTTGRNLWGPGQVPRFEAEADPGNGDRRRARPPRSYRVRMWMLAVVLAVVWLGLVFDPVGRLLLLPWIGRVAVALGVILAALALGWLGLGLFAMGDRLATWLKKAGSWPEE